MSESNPPFPPEQVHAITLLETGSGPTIRNVEYADYCGIRCIRGYGVGPTDELWAHGQVAYVVLDRIKSVVIFENIEAFRAARKRHDSAKQKKSLQVDFRRRQAEEDPPA